MENPRFADQRRLVIARFFAAHETELRQRGSIVATWRRRRGQLRGPYWSLIVRDACNRQKSIYLGADDKVVEYARAELIRLQARRVSQRKLDHAQKQVRRALQEANQRLSQELTKIGLTRKGNEIRGWSRAPLAHILRGESNVGTT